MIKAKKGLLIGLFAAMMVFAFGATSVFAQSYDSKDASGHDAVCSGGVVSTIDWDTDGAKYADVEVTATDNTQKWFRFDYMKDEQITALKATKPSKDTHVFILRDWGETDLDTTSNGVVRANVRRMAYL